MQIDIKSLKIELKQGFRALYGERLKGLYIFGSYARGEARPDSDLDVLVVLDEFRNFAEEIDISSQLVSDLSLKHDISISVIYVRISEWSVGQNPFLQNVRREAVAA